MRVRSSIILFVIILLAAFFPGVSNVVADKEPVDWVDPLIGTAGSRWFFFSSACRPFGMVNLSPDTDVLGAWNSGYLYNQDSIRGFSHVHAWQLSGVPVMPVTGDMKGPAGSDSYKSRFSHDNEIVRPGYHSVILEDYKIRAELTSTDRVAFHRYTFPAAKNAHVLLDLGARLGPSAMADAHAKKISKTEIEGYVINDKTLRRPKPTPIYFVARFNKPFEQFGGWKGREIISNANEISGKGCGAFVSYSMEEDEELLLKVAISYVSIDNARLNMDTELPHWDFNRVAQESREVWNDWLGRIEVEGGTAAQRTRFYTDLWHALLGRRIVSDVNGEYSDMTGPEKTTRQIPLRPDGKPEYNHYNSDAFWGAQWTISLLWSLAYPETMSEFVNCMVDIYKNGGLIPRGPSGGNYTFAMTGASSTPFIVAAYQKGIRDFDVETAYQGLRKNHLPGGIMGRAGYEHNSEIGGGIEYYIERGYVPERIMPPTIYHPDGAGQTLEYAFQDWCLAQMAGVLDKKDDYDMFMERAGNYRNIFDPSENMFRPRTLLGAWYWPFNPRSGKGWVEGNALQFRWWAPHDVEGLIQLMGGREVFSRTLDQALAESESHDFVSRGSRHPESINYGNQPGMAPAHLFNYSGAPWLSQKWVRVVKEKAHGGTTPELGYRGDEDQGILGALGVLMAIGLFDVQGGCAQQPVWQITSPIFDKVVIHLDPRYYEGGKFIITTKNNSKENMYIQSALINGEALNKPWIYHSDIVGGGELVLELGPQPNKNWGNRPQDAPPSMTAIRN